MAKYNLNIEHDDIDEIVLNEYGDSISVSGDDANLWDRFIKACEEMEEMRDNLPDDAGSNNNMQVSKMSDDRIAFCKKGVEIIDGVFGDGTARKSFRKQYESISDFLPDEWKFIAFFDTMMPIMEDIFSRKMERSEKESKDRMAKYQPQDHKRKGSK
ncbi:hypothetical protein [Bacteroides acidifaciens]|uniref:hypothetical protein n=1 Tax=Bacteroides acidifaciens TaxID=85831 RepID=UPI0025B0855D|nr:hypothetical protein [Bacteroides acidifaciens]